MSNLLEKNLREFLSENPEYQSLWEYVWKNSFKESEFEQAVQHFSFSLHSKGVIHYVLHGNKRAYRIALTRKQFMEKVHVKGSDVADLLEAYKEVVAGAANIELQKFLREDVEKLIWQGSALVHNDKKTHPLLAIVLDRLASQIARSRFRCPNCHGYTSFIRLGTAWYCTDHTGHLAGRIDVSIPPKSLGSMKCGACKYMNTEIEFQLPVHEFF